MTIDTNSRVPEKSPVTGDRGKLAYQMMQNISVVEDYSDVISSRTNLPLTGDCHQDYIAGAPVARMIVYNREPLRRRKLGVEIHVGLKPVGGACVVSQFDAEIVGIEATEQRVAVIGVPVERDTKKVFVLQHYIVTNG